MHGVGLEVTEQSRYRHSWYKVIVPGGGGGGA